MKNTKSGNNSSSSDDDSTCSYNDSSSSDDDSTCSYNDSSSSDNNSSSSDNDSSSSDNDLSSSDDESASSKIKQICRKCEKNLTLDNYSNPTKEKRCRQCVRNAKNSENKKDKITDVDETDETCDDWQGGKYEGTVFQRKDMKDSQYASVKGKQQRFKISDYDSEKLCIKAAEKWKKKKSDELMLTKNKYKIIFDDDDDPKYLLVMLTKGYCMLTDYDQLDFIKNNIFCVSKSSKIDSKMYCVYSLDGKMIRYHRYIADLIDSSLVGDHIDGMPLDNRKKNLRGATVGENNFNKNTIKRCFKPICDTSVKKIDDDEFKCIIFYKKIKDGKTLEKIETFSSNNDAKKWMNSEINEITEKYGRNEIENTTKTYLDPKKQKYTKEFLEIMKEHAVYNGLKLKYNNDNENEFLNDIEMQDAKNTKTSEHEENKFIKRKIEKYNIFKESHPKFEITKDLLTNDGTINHIHYKENEYKYCSNCGDWLVIDLFQSNKSNYDKKERICKSCKSDKNEVSTKQWKDKNKDHISEYNKQYREENKEKIQKYYKKSDKEKEQVVNARTEKYFNKFVELVEEKGGECLSKQKDYENAHTKLKVQCKNDHTFEISANNANGGKWCLKCHRNKNKQESDDSDDEITHKVCTECDTKKEISDFRKKANNKDGFDSKCKKCRNKIETKERDKKREEKLKKYEKNRASDSSDDSDDESSDSSDNSDDELSDSSDDSDDESLKSSNKKTSRASKISHTQKKYKKTAEGKENTTQAHIKRSKTMAIEREELRSTITHKVCGKCKKNKKILLYCKKSDTKDGFQSYCKECNAKNKIATRKKNKIAVRK